MGRIRGLFCSFCLDDGLDHMNGESAFDHNIDVSHLATPHITTNTVSAIDRSLTPGAPDTGNEERYSNSDNQHPSSSNSFSLNSPLQNNHYQQEPSSPNHANNQRTDDVALGIRTGLNTLRETSPSRQSSPSCLPPAIQNLYGAQQQTDRDEPALNETQNQNQYNLQRQATRDHPDSHQSQAPPPPPPPPPIVARNPPPPASNGTATKLSYDIISVREPLAKILAERQQLLQSQQQHRPVLGDHEYIEVYGERGSSCFYEEIAGSVTSSATYDQIGAASNHNYQVLFNAYSVANRQPVGNQSNSDMDHASHDVAAPNPSDRLRDPGHNRGQENDYDTTTNADDQVGGRPSSARISSHPPDSRSSSSNAITTIDISNSDDAQLTQSIPVYSVINKAARRGNPITRSNFKDNLPPKPPPKNLFITHQRPSTSAMIHEDTSNVSTHDTDRRNYRSNNTQIPSTSSYQGRIQSNDRSDPADANNLNRLPQPPPRHSKNNAFNHTTDRPLPSPNGNTDKSNNSNNRILPFDSSMMSRDDIESSNNGYELLRSNFEDDHIDVGYEKIRESNRYSGGSISSQFYSRPLLDNGGYESVQPIYSSPSNCYEVLNPATASEIAAAAAAKLNVIEKSLNKDQ